MKHLLLCLIGASLPLWIGCGPKLPYEVVPFAGTVTYQGNPVPGLPIFYSPEEGRPSNGYSDKDGKFNMVYTARVDGIQTGKGTFYVELNIDDGRKYENRELLDTIAKKYGKGNDLLQCDFKKKETNYELKLE